MDNQIESVSKRVERVEGKIDDLLKVLISMARAEEKLVAIAENVSEIREENRRLIEKVSDLEEEVSVHKESLQTTKRVGFLLLGGLVSLGLSHFM